MAYIQLNRENLKHNYLFLENTFRKSGIEWGVVSKLLCGNPSYIKELIELGARELHDTRISNLKTIKSLNSDIQTVYIKPPAPGNVKEIIECADVSFNTELTTIRLLSDEAVRQNKQHKIIIMIEMGDLREGVMGDELIEFYGKIFELPNITVVGVGTNLNCLNGVMPSEDKLVMLGLYKQLIETRFGVKIPYVSGGTTVTFPLLLTKQLPKAVNHFRIGEALFFGVNLFTGSTVDGMKDEIFELHAEIIELHEKPIVPVGEFQENPSGELTEINEEDYGKTTHRAILDVGLLDVKAEFLHAKDAQIQVIGASSDMLVIDLGDNDNHYKVGDTIAFEMRYMGALGLMNSDYIEKRVA
ncbi:alanine/ornithine racemase family PLP-dependent enzyme [bacterium]|nr:MAG: alanine/ornithine racemase family PLP-dependent enzyme [bacterium]